MLIDIIGRIIADKLLTPEIFVAGPMYTREIVIQVYDENLINEMIRYYEK